MVRHTLKILQFYHKTFKVCLTLLERYALKRQDLNPGTTWKKTMQK